MMIVYGKVALLLYAKPHKEVLWVSTLKFDYCLLALWIRQGLVPPCALDSEFQYCSSSSSEKRIVFNLIFK